MHSNFCNFRRRQHVDSAIVICYFCPSVCSVLLLCQNGYIRIVKRFHDLLQGHHIEPNRCYSIPTATLTGAWNTGEKNLRYPTNTRPRLLFEHVVWTPGLCFHFVETVRLLGLLLPQLAPGGPSAFIRSFTIYHKQYEIGIRLVSLSIVKGGTRGSQLFREDLLTCARTFLTSSSDDIRYTN